MEHPSGRVKSRGLEASRTQTFFTLMVLPVSCWKCDDFFWRISTIPPPTVPPPKIPRFMDSEDIWRVERGCYGCFAIQLNQKCVREAEIRCNTCMCSSKQQQHVLENAAAAAAEQACKRCTHQHIKC